MPDEIPKKRSSKAESAQVAHDSAAGDKPPSVPRAKRVTKPTLKLCQGVIDGIEAVAGLLGHQPDEMESKAAANGLLAACRKSPFVAGLVTGAISAGDYAIIAIGLGGLVARLGSDVIVARRPEFASRREAVYTATSVAYIASGAAGEIDLSGLLGSEVADDELAARRAPSADRGDGQRQNVSGEGVTILPPMGVDAGE